MDVVKPQIYDVKTGSPADVPEEQIPQAILSGKFAFPKGARIPIIHPETGEPGTIPSDHAADAFKSGVNYDPSTNQIERIKTEENSGFVKGAEAFGAGAARGATLGLSDVAMPALGISSKDQLADLQKYRPGWSGAGELAGAVGSIAAAPEIGPVGLISKAGKAATEASEVAGLNLAGRGLEATGLGGNPLAAKVLSTANQVGAHAIGSAVEGSLYSGIGNSISEAALGDPDLNGQKVLSNFGYGALFGGALGGALKGAEIAVPEALTAAKEGIVSLKNTLIGSGVDDAGLVGKVLPENLSEALANRATNLGKDQLKELVENTSKDLSTVHNNIQTTLRKLNDEIRPQETDALINTADPQKVIGARQEIINSLNQAVKTMRDEPELYSGGAARKIELYRDGLVNKLGKDMDDPAAIFSRLKDLKQELNSKVFGKIPTSAEEASIKLMQNVSAKINSTLKDPDIFGHAGASLAAHDEMLSKYYKFVPPGSKATDFTKAFMKKTIRGGNKASWEFDPTKVERVLKTGGTITGEAKMNLLNEYYKTLQQLPEHLENTYASVPNERFDPKQLSNILENSKASANEAQEKYQKTLGNKGGRGILGEHYALAMSLTHPVLGAAVEAYNIARNPLSFSNKLAALERITNNVSNKIGRGAAAIFNPSIKTAGKYAGILGGMTSERHTGLSDKISEYQSNPEKLMNHLAENTDDLHKFAPDTSTGVQSAAARATQFLASKLPPKSSNPFSEKYEPSAFELAKFDRYHSIIEKPISALSQVRDNTLNPETVETLSIVYPKLYDEMKQAVQMQAAKAIQNKQKLSFQTKQSISQFLQSPIDESLMPGSIAVNQMTFQNAPQPNQVGGKQKQNSAQVAKMDISDKYSLSQRNEES